MNRDIAMKTEDAQFSYRVAGLLIKDGAVLLQKPKNDGYATIGGQVQLGETAEDALRREYREELGVEITVERLFAVSEIFFSWGQTDCHQLCLYFLIDCQDDRLPKTGSWLSTQHWKEQKLELDFCWVPVEDIPEEGFYPVELLPYLRKPPEFPVHFISKE